MINNSNKLKAEIQKITKGDSLKSQTYLQNFFMERFLKDSLYQNIKINLY